MLASGPRNMAECVRAHPSLVVNIEDFTMAQSVGRGGAGEVFKAFDSKEKVECCVKQIYSMELSEKQMNHLIREIHTMAVCNNRFIIPIKGFTAFAPYSIVLEYLSNGSLDDAIFKPKKPISETRMNIIALCAANGMAHLHSKGVMHRDLKPGNILLDSKNLPRICDFGLARLDDQRMITRSIGTPCYMAPEQIRGKTYDKRVDIYAFGIMLFEMNERTRAYTGFANKLDLAKAVSEDNVRPSFTKKTLPNMQELIKRCWDKDPNKRPSFSEIFEELASGSAVFKDAEFKKVKNVVDQIRENEKKKKSSETSEAASQKKPRVNIEKVLEQLGASADPEPKQKQNSKRNADGTNVRKRFQESSSSDDDNLSGKTPIVHIDKSASNFDEPDPEPDPVPLDKIRDVDFIDKDEEIVYDDSVAVSPDYQSVANPLVGIKFARPTGVASKAPKMGAKSGFQVAAKSSHGNKSSAEIAKKRQQAELTKNPPPPSPSKPEKRGMPAGIAQNIIQQKGPSSFNFQPQPQPQPQPIPQHSRQPFPQPPQQIEPSTFTSMYPGPPIHPFNPHLNSPVASPPSSGHSFGQASPPQSISPLPPFFGGAPHLSTGEHPCPEVRPPPEEPLPASLPPKPNSIPVFIPVPNYPEGSPDPFNLAYAQLPVDPQQFANPSSPTFVPAVQRLAQIVLSNDLQAAARVLSPFTARNIPANAQLAVLKALFRISVKNKTFIDMIIECGAFKGMPFANKECEIAAADLLALVCKFRPNRINSTFFPQFIYLARSRPLDVTVLIKFLMDSYQVLDNYMPSFILTLTSLFANTNAASRGVAIISQLLSKQNFYEAYRPHALRQLVAFSQTTDPVTARNAYNTITKFYDESIALDYSMMLYHLNFPTVRDSVISLMLVIRELPTSLTVSQALIEAAKNSTKAGLLLQKYADTSINQANLFLYDKTWAGFPLPSAADALKLLLILYKYIPMRSAISSTDFFPQLLKLQIQTRDPFTFVALIVLLRRSDLNPQKIITLSQQEVFKEFYQIGLSLNDVTVAHNLIVLTDTIIRTYYVPDVKIIIPYCIDFIIKRNQDLYQNSYQILVGLSAIEDAARYMKECGAGTLFDTDSSQPGMIIAQNIRKVI